MYSSLYKIVSEINGQPDLKDTAISSEAANTNSRVGTQF